MFKRLLCIIITLCCLASMPGGGISEELLPAARESLLGAGSSCQAGGAVSGKTLAGRRPGGLNCQLSRVSGSGGVFGTGTDLPDKNQAKTQLTMMAGRIASEISFSAPTRRTCWPKFTGRAGSGALSPGSRSRSVPGRCPFGRYGVTASESRGPYGFGAFCG